MDTPKLRKLRELRKLHSANSVNTHVNSGMNIPKLRKLLQRSVNSIQQAINDVTKPQCYEEEGKSGGLRSEGIQLGSEPPLPIFWVGNPKKTCIRMFRDS